MIDLAILVRTKRSIAPPARELGQPSLAGTIALRQQVA